jgi:hypothetical protein
MWSLLKPTFAARLNESELDELNAVLTTIQESHGDFSSAKDALMTLVRSFKQEAAADPEPIAPIEQPENNVIVDFSDNQLEVLKRIQENRAKKLKSEPEQIPQIIKKMIFNEAALYNHSFKFYTGL